MKQILTVSDIADELMADEYAGWSYAGARALAEYLDDLDTEMDVETELDCVALRCEFSQHASAWDAMKQYQPEDMPTIDDSEGMDLVELGDAQEEAALEWLEARKTVIRFDTGIIIANI